MLLYNFLPKSAAFFSKVTMIDSNIAKSESWVFIMASNSWRRRWISLSLTSIWCLRLDSSDCNASFFFPEFSTAVIYIKQDKLLKLTLKIQDPHNISGIWKRMTTFVLRRSLPLLTSLMVFSRLATLAIRELRSVWALLRRPSNFVISSSRWHNCLSWFVLSCKSTRI